MCHTDGWGMSSLVRTRAPWFVYMLQHQHQPHRYKVGKTRVPLKRVQEVPKGPWTLRLISGPFTESTQALQQALRRVKHWRQGLQLMLAQAPVHVECFGPQGQSPA